MLSAQEIVIVREIAHDRLLGPEVVQELSAEFNVTTEEIEEVLDGDIAQEAGGPLRPLPLQGCNPKYLEATRNRQRFVRGVIQRAFQLLTPSEFERWVNSHGMTTKEAQFYLRNLGASNDRLNAERYRGVLIRHASGQSIEQAVTSFNKRARLGNGKGRSHPDITD